MAPALEGEPVRALPMAAPGEPQIVSVEPAPEPAGGGTGIVDEFTSLLDSLFAGGTANAPSGGGETTSGPTSTDRERK
jgi:hypothetical protein